MARSGNRCASGPFCAKFPGVIRLVPLLLVLAFGASCRAPSEDSRSERAETKRAPAVVSGRAPRATGGFPSVVTLEPATALNEPPPPHDPPALDQFGTAFHPRVLLARAGETVAFLNSEDVLHNVHVKERGTGETVFNVATLPYGKYEYRFDAPGVYDVSCDTHPAMAAFIVVTALPYATVTAPDGAFELRGVSPGRYRVEVWNLDPERSVEREVTVEPPRTELELAP